MKSLIYFSYINIDNKYYVYLIYYKVFFDNTILFKIKFL